MTTTRKDYTKAILGLEARIQWVFDCVNEFSMKFVKHSRIFNELKDKLEVARNEARSRYENDAEWKKLRSLRGNLNLKRDEKDRLNHLTTMMHELTFEFMLEAICNELKSVNSSKKKAHSSSSLFKRKASSEQESKSNELERFLNLISSKPEKHVYAVFLASILKDVFNVDPALNSNLLSVDGLSVADQNYNFKQSYSSVVGTHTNNMIDRVTGVYTFPSSQSLPKSYEESKQQQSQNTISVAQDMDTSDSDKENYRFSFG